MKIKEEYILQNIADKWIVIDTNGRSVNFNKILSLNESGRLLWEKLENGAEVEALVNALSDEFGIKHDIAEKDVMRFIEELKVLECLDEE